MVGAVVVMAAISGHQDIVIGLVMLWAYFGILSKHQSPLYFDNAYPLIITTLYVTMAIVAGFVLYMIYSDRRKARA